MSRKKQNSRLSHPTESKFATLRKVWLHISPSSLSSRQPSTPHASPDLYSAHGEAPSPPTRNSIMQRKSSTPYQPTPPGQPSSREQHPAFRHASVDDSASPVPPSWVGRPSTSPRASDIDIDSDTDSARSETSTLRGDTDTDTNEDPPPRRFSTTTFNPADTTAALSALLAAGFPLDQLDRSRNRAILWASESGSALCVAYCLHRWHDRAPAHRFSVPMPKAVAANLSSREPGLAFARDEYKLDPVHLAARAGHAEVVELLLREAGVPVDADSEVWGTPLHLAAQFGRRSVVRSLVEAGADVNRLTVTRNQSPLQLAAESGHNAIVRYLLERGALVTHGRRHGALHSAAELGNIQLALLLLDRGADVNALNNSKRTPLHLAARDGHTQIVALLVSRGATLHLRDDARGMTPLDHAVRNGHEEVVRLLLAHGVDATSRDAIGWTPLHLAAQGGHTELVGVLLDYGVPLEGKTGKGKTALQLAAAEGNEETVAVLRRRDMGSRGGNGTGEAARGGVQGNYWARSQSTSLAGSRVTLVQDGASMRSSRAASLY